MYFMGDQLNFCRMENGFDKRERIYKTARIPKGEREPYATGEMAWRRKAEARGRVNENLASENRAVDTEAGYNN